MLSLLRGEKNFVDLANLYVIEGSVLAKTTLFSATAIASPDKPVSTSHAFIKTPVDIGHHGARIIQTVVIFALLRIPQDRIGFIYLFELLFRGRVSRMMIRMVLES